MILQQVLRHVMQPLAIFILLVCVVWFRPTNTELWASIPCSCPPDKDGWYVGRETRVRPTNDVSVSHTVVDSMEERTQSHKPGMWLAVELEYEARNKPANKFEVVVRDRHGYIWHEVDRVGLSDARSNANNLVVGIPTKKMHLFEVPKHLIKRDLSISVFESGGLMGIPDNEIKVPVFANEAAFKKITADKARRKPIRLKEGAAW